MTSLKFAIFIHYYYNWLYEGHYSQFLFETMMDVDEGRVKVQKWLIKMAHPKFTDPTSQITRAPSRHKIPTFIFVS
jgi:hypothetical protein